VIFKLGARCGQKKKTSEDLQKKMKKKLIYIAYALTATCLTSSVAMAAPACTGTTLFSVVSGATTGQELTSSFSCSIGAETFGNFIVDLGTGYTGGGFSLSIAPTASGVGLVFSVAQGGNQDFDLRYSFSPAVSGMTLQVGPNGSVNESACNMQQSSVGVCSGTTLGSGGVGVPGGSSVFIPFLASNTGVDWIFKDVNGVSEFAQILTSPVPEPVTLSMMGIGLLGLGLISRRKKS
jgi:hypothetical protein